MSQIFYRLKTQDSARPNVYKFDGAEASVFDIKQEIMRARKLGKDADFDLIILNSQTLEEYKDDNFFVPRNTEIIWKRMPPAHTGKGTAQRYVLNAPIAEGKGSVASNVGMLRGAPGSRPMGERFGATGGRNLVYDSRQQNQPAATQQAQPPSSDIATAPAPEDDSEEARIQAMFQQTTSQWNKTQDVLATQQYIQTNPRGGGSVRGGRGGYPGGGQYRDYAAGSGDRDGNNQDRVPPPNYVCFRCGEKGHFIQNCPTNGDKGFDKKPKIKRTTGIPRSFLKVVEEPGEAVKLREGGIMVTPKGDVVVAQADSSSWEKFQRSAPTNYSSASLENLLDNYKNTIPVPEYVRCPLCKHIPLEATIMNCCGTTYCEECISKYLMDNDFQCPSCKTQVQREDLLPNLNVKEFIERYVRDYARSVEQGR